MANVNATNVLIDDAVDKVKSQVSGTIVKKLVPFLTLAGVPVAAWLQDEVGIDLDTTTLAVFIGSSIVGISGLAATYVKQRLQGIYGLHQTLIDQGIDVVRQGQAELERYEQEEVPLPKNV